MLVKYYKNIVMGMLGLCTLFYTTGCDSFISQNAMEILNQEEVVETFYGEGIQKIYMDHELVQEATSKEWKGKKGQYHNEVELRLDRDFYNQNYTDEVTEEMLQGDKVVLTEQDTVTDKELIVYLPYKNLYCIKSMSLVAKVSDDIRVGIDSILFLGSLKEYVMELIDAYEKEYVLTIEEDVRVNNYLTQHIIATPKDKSSQERYEIWVDQNTWLIVKEIAQMGNVVSEFEYIEYELNSKIDEEVFKVNIPANANVEYVYDNLEKLNQVVTLDGAITLLGMPIFYLEEEDVDLVDTRYIESIDEEYGRVELTYVTQGGNKFIIRNSPSSPLYEKIQLGYEQIEVRGIKANYIETSSIKNIEFIDQGIICSVYIENGEMTKEELVNIVNHLKLRNKD